MGYTMTSTNRSIRFNELIKKYDRVDWNDFKTLKYDEGYGSVFHFFKDFDVNDIFDLKEKDYPDLADMLHKVSLWNAYRLAPVTDTNFVPLYKTLWDMYNDSNDSMVALFQKDANAKHEFYLRSMRKAKAELMRDFGTINIRLGDIQRHQRGNVDIPLGGGPDMIRAAYPQPYKNGRFRVWVGDSYIMLVRFSKDGPEIHTVSPYGASNKPDSPHYTDQMQLYANKQTKPMTLNKAAVYKRAEKIYHPQ
jgi:acyl-homoserine-lactone acylase